METVPRNCRFLSPVVVELVLKIAQIVGGLFVQSMHAERSDLQKGLNFASSFSSSAFRAFRLSPHITSLAPLQKCVRNFIVQSLGIFLGLLWALLPTKTRPKYPPKIPKYQKKHHVYTNFSKSSRELFPAFL